MNYATIDVSDFKDFLEPGSTNIQRLHSPSRVITSRRKEYSLEFQNISNWTIFLRNKLLQK